MKGIVISGFGGVGKTELAKKYKNVVDLESILWKWNYDVDITGNIESYKSYKYRTENVDYPQNYIDEIKKAQKQYDIVLIAYSDVICRALTDNGIEFLIAYPEKEAKDIYIERYRKRGNNKAFIDANIESFERAVEVAEKRLVPKMILHGDETLEEYLIKNGYNLEEI